VSTYRELDGTRILDTVRTLERRIAERFPAAGLRGVAAQLVSSTESALAHAPALRRPYYAVRVAAALLVVLLFAGVVTLIASLRVATRIDTVTDLVQTLESGVNDIVFVGIAIWFLGTLESRVKRRRTLAALHELRSLAHIVDMHQLTKDPESVDRGSSDTASSPRRTLDRDQLVRYLDYCSELLALTGKTAALYAQHMQDPVVLGAVTEIENLTTGVSRKIWQKITLIHRINSR